MKCPVCNKDNGANINFCEGCGRKIPRCPTCGEELTCRDRFCSNDGTRLSDDLLLLVPEETVLQEPVWSKPAAPAVFTPDELQVRSEAHSEETVRITPTPDSTPRGTPVIRNSDPVAMPEWGDTVDPQPPERAFCEECGKRIVPGGRFCSDCQRSRRMQKESASIKKGNVGKIVLVLILILLLLFGLYAGGHAILNSELFDWDTSASSQSNKRDDDDENAEEEDEEDASDAAEAATVPAETEAPMPTEAVEGVEDPVSTEPVMEETTMPVEETEPASEAEEDPLLYWIENCDKRYLSAADLEGFDAQMCTYARNACYAKSGRIFNSTQLKNYFSQFDWYQPTISPDNFNASMLNDYQTANISVVIEYERTHGYN